MLAEFKQDVAEGLSASPKYLPSKYLYDKRGSQLFQEIMGMPEYYLTNCEKELFENQKEAIVASINIDKSEPFELIELGAGDGTKTITLLKYLVEANYDFTYIPVDISISALEGLELFLKRELPSLKINPKQGDYFAVLHELKASSKPKLALFIGSNLGNLTDEEASAFVCQISEKLNTKDKLLLGLDLIKSEEVILPAYNDQAGITRAFNLNLLDRINRDLGANFIVDQFEHRPTYTEAEGIAKSYLMSCQDQSVHIASIDTTFHFKAGEKIHTEISRKYKDAVLGQIIAASQFEIRDKFVDARGYFADYILEKQ